MPTGPIIKEGFPLIGAMLIIAVVLGFLGHYVIAIISFILALFFVNFFRNPKRIIPQDPDLILSPADGKITYRHYTMGSFLPAFKDSVGFENERHTICIENDRTSVLVTQIAGLLARRIVSWTDLDSVLERGQLYGMIKFGSCTEIYMDKDVELFVEKGQHITGGDTVIGRLRHE